MAITAGTKQGRNLKKKKKEKKKHGKKE